METVCLANQNKRFQKIYTLFDSSRSFAQCFSQTEFSFVCSSESNPVLSVKDFITTRIRLVRSSRGIFHKLQ